ncbi:MAG TPA: hypothetical protein VHU19_09450 [Pyrinomonadaceae bacterium]|jgi:hypothetical protein|nr:hypothetical protein [Pyrinomonadaceae bacterium]
MSSSEQERVRELAERVARRLSDGPGQGVEGGSVSAVDEAEVAALRASLSEIQRRLADIESHLAHGATREQPSRSGATSTGAFAETPEASSSEPTHARPTWLSGTYVPATAHPSQEQFAGIGEAVSELVEFFEREKICSVEPGGKPCDHCGVCSSRGF